MVLRGDRTLQHWLLRWKLNWGHTKVIAVHTSLCCMEDRLVIDSGESVRQKIIAIQMWERINIHITIYTACPNSYKILKKTSIAECWIFTFAKIFNLCRSYLYQTGMAQQLSSHGLSSEKNKSVVIIKISEFQKTFCIYPNNIIIKISKIISNSSDKCKTRNLT